MNPHEANPSIRQQALAFFGGSLPADEVATLCRPCASSRTCGPIALKRMMAAMIELFCDSFEEAPRDTCIVLDIEIRKIARTEANSWRCSTPLRQSLLPHPRDACMLVDVHPGLLGHAVVVFNPTPRMNNLQSDVS